MSKGQKNVYICRKCGHETVTIDDAEGTTPFMLDCELEACTGMAESTFYQRQTDKEPTLAWGAPTRKERSKLSRAMRDHVDRGGLALYRIRPDGSRRIIKMRRQE